MSSVQALCYECHQVFRTSTTRSETQPLTCLHCGSEFVEFLSEPVPRPRPALFSRSAAQQRTRSVPQGGGGGMAERSLLFLPEASVSIRLASNGAEDVFGELSTLLGPLAQVGRFGGTLSLPRNDYGGALERIVDQLAQLHQPSRTPASSSAVDGLKREQVSTGAEPELCGENCVVCHELYKDDDKVVHLPCGHVFHEDCVLPWFNDHNTCPVCRFALPSEQASNQPDSDPDEVTSAPPGGDRDRSAQNAAGDSVLGLFRASGDPPTSRWFRSQAHPIRSRPAADPVPREANVVVDPHEDDLHFRESILNAQHQLTSLEDRLSEQVEEHRRLQNQIQQLQDQRQMLRDTFANARTHGIEAVDRLEAFVGSHEPTNPRNETLFARLSQAAGRLRNALNRGSSGDMDHHSSSNTSSRTNFNR